MTGPRDYLELIAEGQAGSGPPGRGLLSGGWDWLWGPRTADTESLTHTHSPPHMPRVGGGAWECTSKSGHKNRLAHSLDTVRVSFKSSSPAAANSLPHSALELCTPKLDQVWRGGPGPRLRGLYVPRKNTSVGTAGKSCQGKAKRPSATFHTGLPFPCCVINRSRLMPAHQTRTP